MLDNFKIHTHKEFAALQAERDNLLTKVTELETSVTNLQNMSKDMTEKQAGHNEEIAKLKAEHETAITQLKADYDKQISQSKAEVQTTKESVETKVISTMATIGVPEAELPKATVNESASQLVESLKAMSPTELSNYLTQNRKAVFDALKLTAKKKEN